MIAPPLLPNRQVHRVHLTASSAALVQRGAILLEDALHTATLPGADTGRLVLVRSLDVGFIQPHRSPSALALSVEQRLQHLATTAVHASDPTAARAAAVYFQDALEAYILLACQLAHVAAPTAWFWPLAVPDWQPTLSPRETYQHLLRGVAQLPTGLQAIATFIHVLHSHQALTPLLRHLQPLEAEALLRQFNLAIASPISPDARVDHPDTDSPTSPLEAIDIEAAHRSKAVQERLSREDGGLSQEWLATLQQWVITWGPTDPRSHWLTAIVLIHRNPAQFMNPALMERSHQLIQIFSKNTFLHRLEPSAQDVLQPERTALLAPRPDAPLFSTLESPDSLIPLASTSQVDPPVPLLGKAFPTAYGGFFFLISLLNILGLPAFLQHHPHLIEQRFPLRLLMHLASHFLLPDDPIQDLLQDLAGDIPLFNAPLFGGGLADVQVWMAAIQHWCDRHLEHLTLSSLICRPAHLTTTATHWDVHFKLQQVDSGIRKVGLDLDPGWVPWLGRVVLFHYHGDLTHVF